MASIYKELKEQRDLELNLWVKFNHSKNDLGHLDIRGSYIHDLELGVPSAVSTELIEVRELPGLEAARIKAGDHRWLIEGGV